MSYNLEGAGHHYNVPYGERRKQRTRKALPLFKLTPLWLSTEVILLSWDNPPLWIRPLTIERDAINIITSVCVKQLSRIQHYRSRRIAQKVGFEQHLLWWKYAGISPSCQHQHTFTHTVHAWTLNSHYIDKRRPKYDIQVLFVGKFAGLT